MQTTSIPKSLLLLFYFILCSIIFSLSACMLRGKVLQSTEYENIDELKNVHLTVIGSKNTKVCFDYLEDYLNDSLTSHHLNVESNYYCCRDKNTDIESLMTELVPNPTNADHIMGVIITKDVIGYGTESQRELSVVLLNTKANKIVWSGKLRVKFDWFISDDNYRDVAQKINKLIIVELAQKGIIK